MIPDQQLQQVSRLEHGKTYFRFGGGMRPLIFKVNDSGQKERLADCVYFGPIDTTPSVIDLSHFDLSKIEPKKQPDRPGVWHLSKSTNGFPDANILVSQELFDHPSDWDDGEYRFLCDFIPPRQPTVIPPKPENVLHLMRLTKSLDEKDRVGEVRWCIKGCSDGYLPLGDDGVKLNAFWSSVQCEPVTE